MLFFEACGASPRGGGGAPPTTLILLRNQWPWTLRGSPLPRADACQPRRTSSVVVRGRGGRLDREGRSGDVGGGEHDAVATKVSVKSVARRE